ncbi:Virus X resistance protein-like, coiled-coil domain [Sesbania bispinosa]|nr:Virus X resistance protein-like, coiled-coil domain [Sesbania bispinosa]
MAESFLFCIAESLIAKLASRAYEEASQVLGVYDTLQEFTHTLSYVKAVLLDAEQKQEDNQELQEWLRQIKLVLYDAENVLEEVESENLRKQVVKAHGSSTKSKVGHFFSNSNPLVIRYRMARKIEEIKNRLDKVASDRYKFGLQIIDVDNRRVVVQRREMTYSRVDSDVIGREHDKEKIIQLLIQCDDNDKNLSVIPIVGIGGLGKTTLAKLVFNDKRIDDCFILKMWVCVSVGFNIKQLIIKIINSANDFASTDAPVYQQSFKDLDIEQLQNHLTKKLKGAVGSKILVTTRSHNIASMMGTIPSHILEGLSLEDSLSVFIKWAFKEGEEGKYPHLIEGDILPALKLSYDQMPFYLKQCFALFSLYPKDYTFNSFEVTSLSRALGLLPSPNGNKILKHSVNQYLYELLSISFIQDFVDYGIGFTFKIHYLVHELAKSVAFGDCLLANYSLECMDSIARGVRHLSFRKDVWDDEFGVQRLLGVRTILFPIAGVGAHNKVFLNACMSRCKYLRFLDLSDSTYKTLPQSIGKLKHLRYFSITNNKKIKRLPNSICNLLKLEVLILIGCTQLEKLPKDLRKLTSLQHLEITTKLCVLPEDEIANLSSLRTLRIEFCNNLESLFGGIKLPKLRVLRVANCMTLKSLSLNSEHFPALETLFVDNCDMLELSQGHEKRNSNLRLKLALNNRRIRRARARGRRIGYRANGRVHNWSKEQLLPNLKRRGQLKVCRTKPVESTVNTLAGALYKVFLAPPDLAMKEMCHACFDYPIIGGLFSEEPVFLL